MTLMTNDLNDHHDRMVVVEFFCFDKKKQRGCVISLWRTLFCVCFYIF